MSEASDILFESDLYEGKKYAPELSTYEWWVLRNAVIVTYGSVCMKCGSTKYEPGAICIDHVLPVSQYPEHIFDINNLQVLCRFCNKNKGHTSTEDYRPADWQMMVKANYQHFVTLNIVDDTNKKEDVDFQRIVSDLRYYDADDLTLSREFYFARMITLNHHVFINKWINDIGADFSVRYSRYDAYHKLVKQLPSTLKKKINNKKLSHFYGLDQNPIRKACFQSLNGRFSHTSMAYAQIKSLVDSAEFLVE